MNEHAESGLGKPVVAGQRILPRSGIRRSYPDELMLAGSRGLTCFISGDSPSRSEN